MLRYCREKVQHTDIDRYLIFSLVPSLSAQFSFAARFFPC